MKIDKKLLAIMLSAFGLRVLWLKENLFFGWEQGRDFLKISQIVRGDIALIGPKTDIDGIFHGAMSYYSFVPLYLISFGNPLYVLLLLIIINVSAIYFLYSLLRAMFNKQAAYVGAIVYATSYSAIIYSRWLLHESPIPGLAIVLLYLVYNYKKRSWFIPLAAFVWVLIFHLALQNAIVLLPVIGFLWYIQKVKVSRSQIFKSAVVLVASFAPYLVFELKHNFVMLKALSGYFSGEHSSTRTIASLDPYWGEITDSIMPRFRDYSKYIFYLASALLLYVGRKNMSTLFAVLFLLSGPIIFLVIGFSPLRHFYIYVPVAFSFFVAAFYFHLSKKFKYIAALLIMLLVISNALTAVRRLPESYANFIHHAQRTYLADQLALLDYAYGDAAGKEFSYDYFSIPYWKNESWEYLFNWYGISKHGYRPVPDRTNVFYVFIEPDETQPMYQSNWHDDLDKESKIVSEFKSGKLTVEKRVKLDI